MPARSPERSGPSTLRPLARRLLIVTATFLAGVAPARADLVRLDPAGAALARRDGGTALVRELGIWRVPAASLPALRRAGVIRFSEPERLLPVESAAEATDPLVPTEWWRAAIGADSADPPGPGQPVAGGDPRPDRAHPDAAGRPPTV